MFSRITWPISTKLSTKHYRVMGIQVCSNEGSYPFLRGDNNEITKIHWQTLKIFLRTMTNFNQGSIYRNCKIHDPMGQELEVGFWGYCLIANIVNIFKMLKKLELNYTEWKIKAKENDHKVMRKKIVFQVAGVQDWKGGRGV